MILRTFLQILFIEMASLAGYNPNASLLPNGSGAIQPMSGGGDGSAPPGYNASVSLLPSSGGDIVPFRGGSFMNSTVFTGGEDNTNWNTARELAGKSISEGKNNESLGLSTPIAPIVPITPITSPIPATEPIPTITPSLVPTIEPIPAPISPTISIVPSLPIESTTKSLTLFGEKIELDDPKKLKASIKNSGNFDGDYLKALELFGVEGPAVTTKEKLEILQALYDGKCNTDAPMGILEACEPIRRIVQTLALNLLSKIQPVVGKPAEKNQFKISTVDKEEKLKVTWQGKDDGSVVICLTFEKDQLGLISRKVEEMLTTPPVPNENKKNNETIPVPNENKKNEEVVPVPNENKKTDETVPVSNENKKTDETVPVSNENKKTDETVPVPNENKKTDETVPVPNENKKNEEVVPVPNENKKNEEVVPVPNENKKNNETVPVPNENKKNEEVVPAPVSNERKTDNESVLTSMSVKKGGKDILTTSGIPNTSKTECYCISATQLLFSIPEIRDSILSYKCSDNLINDEELDSSIDIITQRVKTQKLTNISALNSVVYFKDNIICALKVLFESLNAKTTTFSELESSNNINNILNKTNIVSDKYTKYIIKWFISYLNISKPVTSTIANEVLYSQQDTTSFIQFILEIFEKDEALNHLYKLFEFNQLYDSSQNNSILLTVNLKNNEHLSKLIQNENYTIEVNDTIKYLLIKTERGLLHNNTLNMGVDPVMDIFGVEYKLYSSILYSGSGKAGHYTFERFNDNKIMDTTDNLSTIDSILYNDGTVTYYKEGGNTVFPISTHSTLMLYRIIPANIDVQHKNELKTKEYNHIPNNKIQQNRTMPHIKNKKEPIQQINEPIMNNKSTRENKVKTLKNELTLVKKTRQNKLSKGLNYKNYTRAQRTENNRKIKKLEGNISKLEKNMIGGRRTNTFKKATALKLQKMSTQRRKHK